MRRNVQQSCCGLCSKRFRNRNSLLKHREATGHTPREVTSSKYLTPNWQTEIKCQSKSPRIPTPSFTSMPAK